MKILLLQKDGSLNIEEQPIPELSADQVLVRITAAALNHRDVWITKGQYAKIGYPASLGSDCCGVVEAVANPAFNAWIGKRVVLSPATGWGEWEKAQHKNYVIRGMPGQGTLAEYIAVSIGEIFSAPTHLSDAECAALPLAGLTAYRAAITKAQIREGMNVLISGIGGGVASFAAQFAVAQGANVYCTTSSEEKLQKAMAMGLKGGFLYSQEAWHKSASTIDQLPFDVILDGACGTQMNTLLDILAPGGTLVFYGATLGRPENLNVHKIFWNQLRIEGSTMGSDRDFTAMLHDISAKQIHPIISHVISFTDVINAFAIMSKGEQFGKIVVTMN